MRKLLLVISLGLLLAGRPVLAQVDMRAAATIDGRCRAEVDAQAVACQPVGTLVQFGSGRLAAIFSYDGALYSFSGSTVDERGEATVALIVDTLRIVSQVVPDRDFTDVEGECVLQVKADSGLTAMECEARRRGETARYRFALDQITRVDRKTFR